MTDKSKDESSFRDGIFSFANGRCARAAFKFLVFIAQLLPVLFLYLLITKISGFHASEGMFNSMASFRKSIYVLIVLTLAACVFSIIFKSLRNADFLRRNSRLRGILAFASVIFFIIGTAAPLSFLLFLQISNTERYSDKAPLLFLTDSDTENNLVELTIRFETEEKRSCSFEWGKEGGIKNKTENPPSNDHVFVMSGLTPGETYFYSIDGAEPLFFRTPPLDGNLRFAAASDAHFGSAESREDARSNALITIGATEEFDVFFILGDIVDRGYNEGHWEEAINDLSEKVSHIPVSSAAGNHDTLLSGAAKYARHMLPDTVFDEKNPSLWRRFDMGGIQIIILDLEWGADTLCDSQMEWLIEQLEEIPEHDWIVVMNHCYYFASGGYYDGFPRFDNAEMISLLTPSFEKYGVDIVISGHNHFMEALEKDGVFYFISGTLGGPLRSEITYYSPFSKWLKTDVCGFLDVAFTDERASVTFRDENGFEQKSFEIEKAH